MSVSLVWEADFPIGFGHTSITYLKRCPGYEDAKNGDLNAAQFAVSRCIKYNRLRELRERYPDGVLLPVLSRNQLPLALAQAIGLPIWSGVHLLHIVPRKSLSAIQRLLNKPTFDGYIQRGFDYILVDDVITQGGTIAALRKFVIVRGGRVVAVTALAYAIGSHAVAPMKRHIVRLKVKFGISIVILLQDLGVAIVMQELTNSQMKYLLRFSSVKNIRKRLAKITI